MKVNRGGEETLDKDGISVSKKLALKKKKL